MTTYHLPDDRPGAWESPLTPGMIVAVRRLGSPRPSPDGAWVAYTQGHDGRTDLYLVPSKGGLPRQLSTDQPVSGGNYCWTPDSRAIIYTSGGKLWRIPAEGGAARQLTEGPGAHLMPNVAPNGALVALVADRDEEVDVGVAPLLDNGRATGSGGAALIASPGAAHDRLDASSSDTAWPLRVSSGPDFTFDPQWAPNSSWLAWMAYDNRAMPWDESRIVASTRVGALGETHVVAGHMGHAHVQPRVAPDGRRIAFLCDGTGWLNVWIVEVDAKGRAVHEARPIAPEEVEHGGPVWPFDIRDLAWSPDGTRIAHLRNVAGRAGIALLNPDTGERTLLTDLPGSHAQIAWCDTDAIVCAFTAPDTPSQIVRIAVPSGERTVLADGAPVGIGAAASALPEDITYQATDGRTAYGFLYTPRRLAPPQGYPLLVSFHGGPTSQVTEEWNGITQYFVGRGWAVAQVNFRGSSGYGKAYKDALNGLWGEGELRDGLGAVHYLAAGGLIDRTRVVAWGGSNGGYDTLYCLSKAPGQFAAGVCLYGISDLPLLSEQTHRFERYYADTLVGPLPEAWARQRELSPLDYAGQVRDPLLILHGAKDTDVPINQAELFVEALKRAGKEYEYHVYPEEGHGWQRSATVLDYLERMDRFLTRHVLMRGR